MLLYGSMFYAEMFIVSFPAYALLDDKSTSLGGIVQHALATAMGVRVQPHFCGRKGAAAVRPKAAVSPPLFPCLLWWASHKAS